MADSSDGNFWARLPRPFTILAPMEDVTDTVFRTLVARRAAPDVLVSEFINARELFHKKRKFARQRAFIDPLERDFLGLDRPAFPEGALRPTRPLLIAQIWGNDPEAYRLAIPKLVEAGFEGIDLNMGCPAEKVVRRGECSGLIDRPSVAAELIQAAREGVALGPRPVPVSVKTRLGVKAPRTEEWAGFLLGLDLPQLTIHGRIQAQMSEGEADWNAVRRVRELRDQMGKTTLIVGNGDLFSAADLDRRHAETGVDGLMVGRGIFRDLTIFDRQRPHTSFDEAPWADRKRAIVEHTLEHRRVWGGQKGFDMLKQFYKVYTRGPEVYLGLRERLFAVRTYEDALAAVEAWEPGQPV